MSRPPLERLLMKVAEVTWRRPGWVLAVIAAVTVVMGVLAAGVRVDSSFMGVLDDDDPAMVRLAEVTRSFPAASSVVLVITEGEEAERRLVAEEAAALLAELDVVSDAAARVDAELLGPAGLIYLPDAEVERLKGALESLQLPEGESPSLEGALAGLRAQLSEARPTRAADPEQALAGLDAVVSLVRLLGELPQERDEVELDLIGASANSLERGPGGAPLRDGFIASEDGEVYAVDCRTSLDPLRVDIGASSFGALEAQIEPLRAAHPALTLRFAGLLPGGYEDQQNVIGKVLPLSTLTLVLVLLALTAIDRSPVTSLVVGLCLLVAMVWTFGIVRLVFGYASLMVTACGIMLFGLGVDYAVHVVVRYNDERAAGVEGEQAMQLALGRTGRGVVIGGLTTITAFALMSLTDFKAAVHLGVGAAIGLGCALALMLTALPASLRLVDRWGRRERRSVELPALNRLVAGCIQRPRLSLGVAGVVLLGVGLTLPHFKLETDLEKIITQDLPALAAAEDLARAFGGSAEAIMSVSESVAQSRARGAAFEALPQVARVDGVHQLIPADLDARLARDQALLPALDALGLPEPAARDAVPAAAVIAELEGLRKIGAKLSAEGRLAGRPAVSARGVALKEAAAAAIVAVEGQDQALARTESLLFAELRAGLTELRAGASLSAYGPEDLPASLRDRYVHEGRYLTLVYPADYRIEFEALQAFKQAVLSIDPEATGTLMVVDQLLVGGLDKLPYSLAAILLALVLILAVDLRDARKVAIALVPLLMGCGVGVSLVIALGVPISVLMLAAIPLIFGIGIDDGVHILHRWDEGGEDVAGAVAATGKAILFTSLTTGLGFSILFLLNHNGLTGMAILVLMGVGTCFLTSVTLLPVLASLTKRE